MTSDTPTFTDPAPPAVEGRGAEPARRRQRADARRNPEAVLAAAHAAFAEHGPDASLDDVARRAGVGIGTVYRNFPTRQALLEAVMGDRLEGLRRQGEELLRSASPGAALTDFLRAQLEHSGDCRGLAASVMISALDRGEGEPTYCQALRQAGAALLARAQDAGAIRRDTDIDDLVRMVNAIGMATEEAPERADRLFALMMDGLRVEVRDEGQHGKWNGRSLREWVPDAVSDIVRQFDPLQVILFGSVARGDEGPDSDIDLLVVFERLPTPTKHAAAVAVRQAITVPAAVDVLVTDVDELAERGDLPGILRVAQREGTVVHARAA